MGFQKKKYQNYDSKQKKMQYFIFFKLSEIEDEILHIVSYVRSLNWGISATVSISSYGNPAIFHGDKKDFAYISSYKDGNFLDENGEIIDDVINLNIKVIPK